MSKQSTSQQSTLEQQKPITHEQKPIKQQSTKKIPTCCIIMGMTGSGKTTFMQRVNAYVNQHKINSYIINLDPAVTDTPFECDIDIRDTVNYKQVMKQYQLGPNGGILTSLNLFATRYYYNMYVMY